MYVVIDDELYHHREGVKLRCIPQEQGQALLVDIYEGICSHHVASRALDAKEFRQGFCWPMALADAQTLVRCYEACQFHSKNIHQPAQALQTIPLSCPFAV
jgi:hypothetical protein